VIPKAMAGFTWPNFQLALRSEGDLSEPADGRGGVLRSALSVKGGDLHEASSETKRQSSMSEVFWTYRKQLGNKTWLKALAGAITGATADP
jgi:hypothetical protein